METTTIFRGLHSLLALSAKTVDSPWFFGKIFGPSLQGETGEGGPLNLSRTCRCFLFPTRRPPHVEVTTDLAGDHQLQIKTHICKYGANMIVSNNERLYQYHNKRLLQTYDEHINIDQIN